MTKRARWTRERLEEIYREYIQEDEDPAKQRKRIRILKAATELFIKHGYRKTSVEDIARRADVAKGTVYLYFPKKVDLLTQAIAVEKRALLEVYDPVLSEKLPPKDRLRFIIGSMFTVAQELPLVARLMTEDGEFAAVLDDMDPAELERSHQQGRAWFSELIEMAAPGVFTDAQLSARADVLLGLRYFIGLLMEQRVRGERSLDEVAKTLSDMLVYGAIHRPPEPEGTP